MLGLKKLFKKREEKFMDWNSYQNLVEKTDILNWQQSIRSKNINQNN